MFGPQNQAAQQPAVPQPHVHDPDMAFCPSMPGVSPHEYRPYFDMRTLSTILFCVQCGDQQKVLPDDPSLITPSTFPQIGSGGQQPTQPQPSPGSSILNP